MHAPSDQYRWLASVPRTRLHAEERIAIRILSQSSILNYLEGILEQFELCDDLPCVGAMDGAHMCQPGRALTLAPRRARSANGIKVARHGWHPNRQGDGSDEERRGIPDVE